MVAEIKLSLSEIKKFLLEEKEKWLKVINFYRLLRDDFFFRMNKVRKN